MAARNSPCTLIVQAANLTSPRVWWTDDDLLSKSPLPFPNEADIGHPISHQGEHPLNEWCQAKYFDEKAGAGFLTELPRGDEDLRRLLFGDKNNPSRKHPRYPNLHVVIVGFTDGKRAKAAERFTEILGNDISSAMPRLAAGIADDDKAIRQMCLQTIGLSGGAAIDAIPALKRELYLAPEGECWRIAKTLGAFGPAGVDVLQSALLCGDPVIRSSARSALESLKRKVEVPFIHADRKVPVDPLRKQALERKRRRDGRIAIAGVCLFLLAVAICAWFFGTWITLAGAALFLVAVVIIKIWTIFHRVRKRVKKHQADGPA